MTKLKAFTMPKWGIEMSEGTLVEWMVAENEAYDRGAVLALIETDKITNEVEAEAGGRFVRMIAIPGETYPVGALLAIESDGGEASADQIEAVVAGFRQPDTSFSHDSEGAPSPAPDPAPALEPAPAPSMPAIPDGLTISPAARMRAQDAGLDVTDLTGSGRGGRITAQDVDQAIQPAAAPSLVGPYPPTPPSEAFASPLARRLGLLHGVALEDLTGSGPRGRIGKADVLARIGAPASPDTTPPPAGSAAAFDVVPMSSIRRTIARRLTESKQTIPHFYLRRGVRADRLLAMRSAFDGTPPTINDYLIKACALALMEVPQVNIQVHGSDIHHYRQADIAVAVASERGLVTPIVTKANLRSIVDISKSMRDLVERAKAGRLAAEEFTGGSFSLSNLGALGIEQFDAIINPPQGAILAVGAARHEPVEDDGAIRLVPVIHLSLSCDHRAIDGADGARFMQALARLIEQPDLLA